MRLLLTLLAPLGLALLPGCTLASPLWTPTGRPEVVVRAPRDEVVAALALESREHAFLVVGNSQGLLVLARPEKGGDVTKDPHLQVTCHVKETERGTWVLCEVEKVTPKKGKRSDVSQQSEQAHEVQRMLESMQSRLALARHARAYDNLAEQGAPAVWTGSSEPEGDS